MQNFIFGLKKIFNNKKTDNFQREYGHVSLVQLVHPQHFPYLEEILNTNISTDVVNFHEASYWTLDHESPSFFTRKQKYTD